MLVVDRIADIRCESCGVMLLSDVTRTQALEFFSKVSSRAMVVTGIARQELSRGQFLFRPECGVLCEACEAEQAAPTVGVDE
jgi:hypothetical protein